MGQAFNGLSKLERDALTDYATEKYFTEPADTRGEARDWVSDYTENLAKNDLRLVVEITRAYAKERHDICLGR